MLDQLTAALREASLRLVADPDTWGDPLCQYSGFGWRLYQRGIGPLYITFVIDDTHKIVYLKSVLPFPGGGLEAVP
jgi:hypothetical protein